MFRGLFNLKDFMLPGLDHLGISQYPDVAKKTFPDCWALGVFANTFGDSMPAVKAIVKTGRCKIVRVQLLWSDNHSFGPKDLPKIKKLAKRWNQFAKDHSDVTVYLSPCCEHNLQNPDLYLEATQAAAPNCIPVNTIWNGALSSNFINEVHGDAKAPSGPYIYSYDGMPCVDADVEKIKKRHSSALIQFFWTSQFNGRKNPNDPTPRPKREAWPVPRLIESIVYLAGSKGSADLPNGYIWKSHSDQHNAPIPEARALKPVLIAPIKVKRFELVRPDGQVVGILPYYGTFDGGGHRYYLAQWGYKTAQKGGNIALDLRTAAGKIVGQVNPAYRQNAYRS